MEATWRTTHKLQVLHLHRLFSYIWPMGTVKSCEMYKIDIRTCRMNYFQCYWKSLTRSWPQQSGKDVIHASCLRWAENSWQFHRVNAKSLRKNIKCFLTFCGHWPVSVTCKKTIRDETTRVSVSVRKNFIKCTHCLVEQHFSFPLDSQSCHSRFHQISSTLPLH